MAIKLEEGKEYITENGKRVTGLIKDKGFSYYQFFGYVDGEETRWESNGTNVDVAFMGCKGLNIIREAKSMRGLDTGKVDENRKYQTKAGREVVIKHIVPKYKNPYPVIGKFKNHHGKWTETRWSIDGVCELDALCFDLEEVESKMEIDKDKNYQTETGNEVRIYATDGNPEGPVHGAVKQDGNWYGTEWRSDGTHAIMKQWNLVELAAKVSGHVRVTPDGEVIAELDFRKERLRPGIYHVTISEDDRIGF